jgi:O-antigen biosynthesis protein WbqV
MAFGAARLLVVEHSRWRLHTVFEALKAKNPQARVDGRIADVRDRERIFGHLRGLQARHRVPAAALKHVPLLERDWGEGVKTNVFGSVNVADAAAASGAAAMVMISTDQGDRAGVGARRDQALRRNVLPGARRGFSRTAAGAGRCG